MGLFENLTEPTQMKPSVYAISGGICQAWEVQIDRSPRSEGVVGASGAWSHRHYARNELGSPYGTFKGRTAGIFSAA